MHRPFTNVIRFYTCNRLRSRPSISSLLSKWLGRPVSRHGALGHKTTRWAVLTPPIETIHRSAATDAVHAAINITSMRGAAYRGTRDRTCDEPHARPRHATRRITD